jgi:hypothetical protein
MSAKRGQDIRIISGQSLSSLVDLGGLKLVGVVMPPAWDAANLTLQGSFDGKSFFDVYDKAGAEMTITTAASRFIVLDPNLLPALNLLKFRSGTAGAAVNQTANRTLVPIVMPWGKV